MGFNARRALISAHRFLGRHGYTGPALNSDQMWCVLAVARAVKRTNLGGGPAAAEAALEQYVSGITRWKHVLPKQHAKQYRSKYRHTQRVLS